MNKINIVFFGAGPVASRSLEFLAENYTIEAVVTKPKAAHHKGDSPVLDLAEKLGIPVITAINKSDLDEKINVAKFKSSLGIIIDFGIIVSLGVINKFEKGIVNSHFSLLPEWRGADPITFSLLSGQKITGVSLMLLSEGMDEGPILAQEILKISSNDTGTTLTEKLISLSNQILLSNIDRYISGEILPIDQIEFAKLHGINPNPTYSSKVNKSDGQIDWKKSGEQIERDIRAYQPWPKCHATVGDNLSIIILKARLNHDLTLKPGKVKHGSGRLFIGTGTSCLELLEVQPYGKNKMDSSAFLRGYSNKLFIQLD